MTNSELSEAALLAALPKAPSRLDPTNGMDAALNRSRLILRIMREEGWITPAQEADALRTPPVLSPPPGGEGDFGYVLDMAQAQARQLSAGAGAPDLIVRLEIDPRLQSAAVRIVGDTMRNGPRRYGASQAALVAIAPDGTIRALVGGVAAAAIGRTDLFVSGGAEHQGPDGGGPVAVIVRM